MFVSAEKESKPKPKDWYSELKRAIDQYFDILSKERKPDPKDKRSR